MPTNNMSFLNISTSGDFNLLALQNFTNDKITDGTSPCLREKDVTNNEQFNLLLLMHVRVRPINDNGTARTLRGRSVVGDGLESVPLLKTWQT